MLKGKVTLIVAGFIFPLCLLMAGVHADDAAPPATPENSSPDDTAAAELEKRIAELIAQLGSNDFHEREAAQQALIEIGMDARDALQAALKSDDAEVAWRAGQILEALKLQKVKITFIILDENGKPLSDRPVKVSVVLGDKRWTDIWRQTWELLTEGVTDVRGAISTAPISQTTAAFKLEVQGRPTVVVRSMEYQEGKHTIPVSIAPGGNVKGRIIGGDGKPLKGKELRIAGVAAISDEMGGFELKNVPCGYQSVSVRTGNNEGHAMSVHIKPGETREVTVEWNYYTLEDYKFRRDFQNPEQQPKQPCVKCTLVNPDGKPIQAVLLFSYMDLDDKRARPWIQGMGRTDENGVCVLNINNPRSFPRNYEITIFAPGCKPLTIGPHNFTMGETWEIREPLKFEKGITAQVLITDTEGNPIGGAKIVAASIGRGKRHGYRDGEWGVAITDNTGAAEVAGLEAADTVFKAGCEGYVISDEKTVSLKEGGNEVVKITLQKMASAQMTLIDADTGKPIDAGNQRVDVWLDYAEFRDRNPIILGMENGGSNPKWITPGRRYIMGMAQGYWPGYFVHNFKPGETKEGTIGLKKQVPMTLKGKIEFSEDVPFTEFGYILIRCLPLSYEYDHTLFVHVQPDGSFSIPDIPEGFYYASVYDKLGREIGYESIAVDRGEKADMAIPLHRPAIDESTGTLEITVKDEDGKPGANYEACLTIYDEHGSLVLEDGLPILDGYHKQKWETTDAEGKCRFEHLPQGRGEVSIAESAGRSPVATAYVDIAPDKTELVTVRLPQDIPQTGAIEGRVISPTECVISAYRIRDKDDKVFYHARSVGQISPDADGSFVIPDLAAGRYAVEAYRLGNKRIGAVTVSITLNEGEHVKGLELRFPDKFQKFSGKCLSSRYREGEEILELTGDYRCQVTIWPDGTFEALIPPGQYKVTRRYGNIFMPGQVDIVIEEGKDLENVEIP